MEFPALHAIKAHASSLRGALIRAVMFAVAWAALPFWLFLIVALILFFMPIAQARSVLAPFLALIGLAWLQPFTLGWAIVFGALFGYILLIKDLYLIDRRTAYEILMLALAFFAMREFYLRAGGSFEGFAAIYALIVAGITGMMFEDFVESFSETAARDRLFRRVAAFAVSCLVFELLIAGLVLPLDFVYQASVIFLLAALIIELCSQYLLGSWSKRKALITSGSVLALIVLILGSARWRL